MNKRELILKYIGGFTGAIATGAGLHSYYLTHLKDISNTEAVNNISNKIDNISNVNPNFFTNFNSNNLSTSFIEYKKKLEFYQNKDILKEGIDNIVELISNEENSPQEKIEQIDAILNKPEFAKALKDLNGGWVSKIYEQNIDKLHGSFASSSNNSGSTTDSIINQAENTSSGSINNLNNNLINIYNKDSIRDQIEKIYNDYFNWMQSLSLIKQGAVIHFIIFLILFLNLFSLITIFYGESLIKYFKLEEKYPRLAKFIQFRRKFQQFHYFTSVLIMVIFLIIGLLFNLWIFMNVG
jgi:phage pi2 protein 07